METLNILGTITNTSKKQNADFFSANPRKSLYLELDEASAKLAEEFGLTRYTSKTDGAEFFIVKASETIKVYDTDGKLTGTMDGTADEVADAKENYENPNFVSDGIVKMALIKGNNKGNDFVRLFAVEGVLLENEASNPFA